MIFEGFSPILGCVPCVSIEGDIDSILFSSLAEDEEDTIAAEEQLEGDIDHAMELRELAREGDARQTLD